MGVSGVGSSAFARGSTRRVRPRVTPRLTLDANLTQSSRERGFPERVTIPQLPSDTNPPESPNIVSGILGAIGKVAEVPISLLNQFTKPYFGERGIIGPASDVIGQTPIGAAVGALNTALDTSSRMVGSVANASDMELLRRTASMPETAMLPSWESNDPIANAVSNLFASIMSGGLSNETLHKSVARQDMTVGQFRQLMQSRGLSPEDMALVQSGEKSPYDPSIGHVRTTDDGGVVGQLGDTFTRMAFDPLNLAFGVGGKVLRGVGVATHGTGVAKIATTEGVWNGMAILPARQAGTSLALGAKTLGEGGTISPTMKSLARMVELMHTGTKRYGIAATGLTAGVAAGDALLTPLAAAERDNNGLYHSLKAFTSDIINERPLSESAAFLVLSAGALPLHDIAGAYTRPVKAGYRKGVGYGLRNGVIDAIGRKNVTALGGEGAVDRYTAFTVWNLALEDLNRHGWFQKMIADANTVGKAGKMRQELFPRIQERAETMIREGKITTRTVKEAVVRHDRVTEGFYDPTDYRTFDPLRAAKTWAGYEPIIQSLGAKLDPIGLTLGRNTSTSRELLYGHAQSASDVAGASPRLNAIIDSRVRAGTPTQQLAWLAENHPDVYAEVIPAGLKGKERLAAYDAAVANAYDSAPMMDAQYVADLLEKDTGVREIDKRMGRMESLQPGSEASGGFDLRRYERPPAGTQVNYADVRARLVRMGDSDMAPPISEMTRELDAEEAAAPPDLNRPNPAERDFSDDAAQTTLWRDQVAVKEAQAAAEYGGEASALPASDASTPTDSAIARVRGSRAGEYEYSGVSFDSTLDMIDDGEILGIDPEVVETGNFYFEKSTEYPGNAILYRVGGEGGRPVGYVIVKDGAIDSVRVDPDFQRSGIATEMYDFLQDQTSLNPYDLIGRSGKFTEEGKSFATKWLSGRKSKTSGAAQPEPVGYGPGNLNPETGYPDELPADFGTRPGELPVEPRTGPGPTYSLPETMQDYGVGRIDAILSGVSDIRGAARIKSAVHEALPQVNKVKVGDGYIPRFDAMTPDRVGEILARLAWESEHGTRVNADYVAQVFNEPRALPIVAKGLRWDKDFIEAYDLGVLTEKQLIDAAPVQRELDTTYGGTYAVKMRPQHALDFGDLATELPDGWLKHQLIGPLLFDGKLRVVDQMFNAMFGKVKNVEVATAARQAWYDEFIGKYNATPAEVDKFMQGLTKRLGEKQLNRTGMLMYRGITSLPVGEIEGAARDAFDEATFQRILASGDKFERIIDRGANRFIRKMHAATLRGPKQGRAGRAADWAFPATADKAYKAWQATAAGGLVRKVSKEYYFMFRFALDPRWWAMNGPEADAIMAARYGMWATRAEGAQVHDPGLAATNIHAGRSVKAKEVDPFSEDLLNDYAGGAMANLRGRNGYLSAALEGNGDNPGLLRGNIDAELNRIVPDTLDVLSTTDPTLVALRERFGDNPQTWSEQLYQMMYDFDERGVARTINEAARAIEVEAEMKPAFQAIVNKLIDVNQKSHDDLSHILVGNMDRSNAERVLNSYWLYWPLSYQLKTGKWLLDVMTKRSIFGPNALGAVAIEEMRKTHIQRMQTDEDYAGIFEKNPTLWQVAQMIVPITPWDMGVSLSRLPRYVGGWMGFWPEYATAQDPLSAAQQMMNLGPIYTVDLLNKIKREALAN